jgi:tetratricopeptide (TPR) repeat protein
MDDVRKRDLRDRLSRDPKGVIAILTKEIRGGAGDDPEVAYLLGVAHFRLGNFPSAESAFRTAISLDSLNAGVFYYLGLSAERQGRNGDAVKAYRTAASLDPALSQAQDKLRKLDHPQATPAASSARHGSDRPGLPKDSSLVLPDTDEEFRDYERRTRRKERIDRRAKYIGRFMGLPWWGKVLMAGSVVFTVIFVLIVLNEMSDMRKRHQQFQKQFHEQGCEQARKQGINMPGC